jgi:hypothetical protein
MSRVPIQCPHCGQTTRVDLALTLSTQKCDRCGIRFSAVNTGLAGSREVQLTEPPEWRRAKTGDWDQSEDTDPLPTPAPASGTRFAWIGVACAIAAVAAGALTLARRQPAVPPVQPLSPQATTSADGSPSVRQPSVLERIEAATAAARRYLVATSVDDLLPLIQNREQLEATVRAYYTEGEGVGQLPLPEFSIAPTERHLWIPTLQSAVVSYETPGQLPRALALRQDPDGRWLVDWPSAAAVGDVPLSLFRKERQTTPRFFRLLAARDDYFNHAFSNDQDWLCLQLSDTTLTHRVYAYARRGTPVAEALIKSRFGKSATGAPVMLRLRFPENAPSDNQVEITEFLGTGWIVASPDPPVEKAP